VDVYAPGPGAQPQLHDLNPSPSPPFGLFWTIAIPGGFAGEFVRNAAQMEWTATVGDLVFRSAPLATSSSSFAEIGHERNGSFFPEGEG
jgi:hypothetical protein